MQYDSKSLYETWEQFKEMLQNCSHHGLPKWLQVQTCYNGLPGNIKTTIDTVAGGTMMGKSIDDVSEFLEKMALNNYS